MTTTKRIAVLAGAALACTLAAATTTTTAASAKQQSEVTLKEVKAATARYHSVTQALADGYSGEHEPCVSSPAGTMGVHYSRAASLADDAIDPLHPETLLYLPDAAGKLTLVAVEYWKRDADQSLSTSDDKPTLFGQAFNGPMPGHSPVMPVHDDLHVWLFADNPAGTFASFNPSLSCP